MFPWMCFHECISNLVLVVSESVKKGKFMTKIFFSVNVEWRSKNLWKTISADVKADKTTINKRSGGSILQIFIGSTFKTLDIV